MHHLCQSVSCIENKNNKEWLPIAASSSRLRHWKQVLPINTSSSWCYKIKVQASSLSDQRGFALLLREIFRLWSLQVGFWMIKMEESLPPGFRFHPTDEELITYYLTPKVSNTNFASRAIADVDLNKCEPWDLPGSFEYLIKFSSSSSNSWIPFSIWLFFSLFYGPFFSIWWILGGIILCSWFIFITDQNRWFSRKIWNTWVW